MRQWEPRTLLVPGLFMLFVAALPSNSFVAIFLVREQGLDPSLVGLALTLQSVVRAIVAPAVGALSDRYGRRAVLLACTASSAVCAPGFLLIHDALTLFAWQVLFGVVVAPFFPVGIALLLDLTPPAKHQSMLALNTGALNVGYTLAIIPTGFLAESGFGWLGLWSAVLFAVVTVALARALRSPIASQSRSWARGGITAGFQAFTDLPFLWLTGLAFVFPLGLGLLVSVVPLYAAEVGWAVSAIGLLLALNGVVVAVFSVPVNAPLERFGAFRSLPIAGLLAALSQLALPVGGPGSLVFCVAVLALSEVVFAATLPVAISMLTPPGARGAYQGAWAMISGLGFGLPLAIAGFTRESSGWPATWLLFGGVTLIATVALAWSVRPLSASASERGRQ